MDPLSLMASMGEGSVLSGLNAGPAGPAVSSVSNPWDQGDWTLAMGKGKASGSDLSPWLVAGALLVVLLWKR
jgi:hypothetical protein